MFLLRFNITKPYQVKPQGMILDEYKVVQSLHHVFYVTYLFIIYVSLVIDLQFVARWNLCGLFS